VSSGVLTVFLWHLTALVAAAAVLAGGLGLTDPPGTAAWWAAKPLYVLVAAVVLAGLVAALAPVERRQRAAPADRRTAVVAAGLLLAGLGLAGVAASGFLHPFDVHGRAVLGLRFRPVVAVALLAAGTWLATRSGRGRPDAVRG
jgi:hypothetical protein